MENMENNPFIIDCPRIRFGYFSYETLPQPLHNVIEYFRTATINKETLILKNTLGNNGI
jgi:hypothetical protein